MSKWAKYDDVVREVSDELAGRFAAATAAGIDPERIVLDPGLGFAKNPEHDWALLRSQERLQRELGRPLLIGHSRKRFIGSLLADDGTPRPPSGRDAATLAVAAVAAARGAWAVRVHAGQATADAVRAVAAMTTR